jgi:hypothetical protein
MKKIISIIVLSVILVGGGAYVAVKFINSSDKEPQTQLRTVKLYYYSPELDKDNLGNVLCSRQGLVSVEREISITQAPIQDTIRLLLQGNLTSEERVAGITTEYPLAGFSLNGASFNDGV